MNKEQFLAMSLPYQTIVCVKYTHKPDSSEYEELTGIVDGRVVTGETEEDDIMLPISDYSIILHPLSDLTKEIEHKGDRFVPKQVLHTQYVCEMIGLNPATWSFRIMLKLIEWHFDICGLIEKGEAIDVNTLSENPYI